MGSSQPRLFLQRPRQGRLRFPMTVPYSTTSPLPVSEDTVIEISEESIRISNYDRLFTRRDDAEPRLGDAKDGLDAHATSRPDAASEEGQEGSPVSPPPDNSKLNAQEEEEEEEGGPVSPPPDNSKLNAQEEEEEEEGGSPVSPPPDNSKLNAQEEEEEEEEGGPVSPPPDNSKLNAQEEEEEEEEEAAPAPSAPSSASRGGRAGPDVLIRVPSRGVNGFARSRNLVQIHVFEGGLPRGFDRGPEPDATEAQEGAEPATDTSATREGAGRRRRCPDVRRKH
ncbi:zinc finger and BTB domain-containing protein 47-like [Penaeus chinensis]|uniref:zinc finger and BTB domain-containing protein 47-like n=1 Tax=Penaeus chinensis TaxID=139456 RepID=UPI001FB6882F|nr:zinc finger and BTB domain-containing protein 47-like [Penaeus chinensis]